MQFDQNRWETSGELLQHAMSAIGFATIFTNQFGQIIDLNPIAETLTGCSSSNVIGKHVSLIFRIEHERTRLVSHDWLQSVFLNGEAVLLSDHTILISSTGREYRIDLGATPIRDHSGTMIGCVLVFCDVSERQRVLQSVESALIFADGIVQTVREPLVVLDDQFRVRTANKAFYETFRLTPSDTDGNVFFDIAHPQWNIPRLRELLSHTLLLDSHFDDFEIDQEFEGLGRRSMVLNARRLPATGKQPTLILLAIEDATKRSLVAEALSVSEVRYRRLFETAQDGILLVDPENCKIFDANPFLLSLLGYQWLDLIGKELWEIGLFRDIESNKKAFKILQDSGYIRYDNLPLKTHDGRPIEVEFVSNVYDVGASRVIQCNIRDVTDRKRAEDALRSAHASLEIRVTERTAELAKINVALKTEIARREVAESDRRELQQQLTTVQENERRRIARELHDQMGQHLTALGLGLKVVKDASPDPSPQRDRLQTLQTLTEVIGKEVHQLALELRPTALDDLGLHAALVNYMEGWSERTGIEIDFHASGLETGRLPSPVETALYRIVQEALTNVLKHANSKRVSIVLQKISGQVSVVIEDDGQGFDSESVGEQRLGILGMRERSALVGGTLVVESDLGRGSTVIARIPLFTDEQGVSR